MITKKCHKLENPLKEEDEKNNEEENNNQKEILIVDVNNNLEDSEEEKEEKDGDEQNEKSINYSKAKLSKPKPILNVDSNSINLTDYQVNDNKYSNYNYPNYSNYSNTRYNFYTGSGSSYYLPKSYSFYCNSNYNNGFRKNNITNNHFNSLASSNDYTYKYRNDSNPYGLNRNNSNIEYNISKNNNNNNNYPYANNNDNHSITYSFYSQQKPNNLRSRSFVKLKNKYNIDDKVDNLRNSKGNNLSMSHKTIPYGYNDGAQTNLYPTKERVTYVLNYYKNNIGSNINNKNNTYRAYNKSFPYKINYNYIYN